VVGSDQRTDYESDEGRMTTPEAESEE